MTDLLSSFNRFVKKERLFSTSDKLLVAVSGGLDSVVLTELLKAGGYVFGVAHCNFQLREKAADEDEEFVKQLGNQLEYQTYTKRFDTKAYAKENNLSTQVAARNLRYEWFDELIKSHGYKFLLTAHHANDQTETILYHLTKGTGVAGLRGIPVCVNNIRRPLLFATRAEIETFAQEQKLSWREDASNLEDKYNRNHLRLNVIPELKKINPGLEQTMQNNQQRFTALEKLLLHQTEEVKKAYLSEKQGNFSLSMDWFDPDSGGLSILNELIKVFGFNWDQNVSIAETFMQNASGKQFESTDYTLYVDRNKLEISSNQSDSDFCEELKTLPEFLDTPFCKLTFSLATNDGKWSNDPNVAYLNADHIEYPLIIRNWNQGDSFQPLGRKGKKKLSDFMIDEKIPVNLKSRVLLIESNKDIIWVVGHRIDDRYKITSDTKKVLIVKMTSHV